MMTRKCVIIAAYANSNPQVAASWAGKLTNWGASFSPACVVVVVTNM